MDYTQKVIELAETNMIVAKYLEEYGDFTKMPANIQIKLTVLIRAKSRFDAIKKPGGLIND